ncbi:ABC transporter permease [Nocardia sp. NBC_00565]|uniref:branched-chain amino acid ABC transporter permease n=1 Tax=Nocardia sp. NBC_00565 TaxID=2975993 RepID=UPI002E808709|nr:ABC transporter permease [Nocardia sp. NBC_00565]WUC05809.1 ABC transporter permease [Nocardia sp. NBC_00565]
MSAELFRSPQLLSYVLAGLALGAIYAIAAASLVVTYVSSGVFNFAFGAMAFAVARFYFFLHVEQGWPLPLAAVVAIGLFGPALGVALYVLLFRYLRLRSPVVKIVATIGLSVALPPLVNLVFGHLVNITAPGLAPQPLKVFYLFGAVVDMNQVITYLGLALVLALGTVLLRYTDIGLKIRALVDSEALTAMSGVSPTRVSLGVWAFSALLAGLAGVLVAPTAGLSVDGMTFLMSAAFAAVVAARLRSLPMAVGVALLMGVVTNVIQRYLDPESPFSAQIVPSIPFMFMLVFLLYYALRGQAGDTAMGGALDRAIRTESAGAPAGSGTGQAGRIRPTAAVIGPLVTIGVIAVFPMIFDQFWTGLTAAGIALAIALLSYTLVTGEGGMIWLCQITFAGLGAVLAAELATNSGWSPLLAVLVSALCMVPIGVILGLLTIRLGNLYVALVTLTFGLLAQNLVFMRDRFYNSGQGIYMPRPEWAAENKTFAYLALAVFIVLGVIVLNLRRSTTGLAVTAVRWSEAGSRTLGLSILQVKVLVSAVATFVAAIGGGFIALNYQSALPDSFNPFAGLVWLAVLVTVGARSITGALVAGVAFTVLPGVFQTYLPTSWAEIPVIMFGFGAIMLARNPEGIIAMHGRQLRDFNSWRERRQTAAQVAEPAVSEPKPLNEQHADADRHPDTVNAEPHALTTGDPA